MVIRLTPNGLSVRALVSAISVSSSSGVIAPQAITPKPPALEIAETRLRSETQLIAPPRIGDVACRGTRCRGASARLRRSMPGIAVDGARFRDHAFAAHAVSPCGASRPKAVWSTRTASSISSSAISTLTLISLARDREQVDAAARPASRTSSPRARGWSGCRRRRSTPWRRRRRSGCCRSRSPLAASRAPPWPAPGWRAGRRPHRARWEWGCSRASRPRPRSARPVAPRVLQRPLEPATRRRPRRTRTRRTPPGSPTSGSGAASSAGDYTRTGGCCCGGRGTTSPEARAATRGRSATRMSSPGTTGSRSSSASTGTLTASPQIPDAKVRRARAT